MPQRNTVGGKAYKKNKKGLGTNDTDGGSRRFHPKNDGQDYGRVTRHLGNRRVLCFCNDGLDRVCKIRGGICRGSHNKQKIEVGDIVLISYRTFDLADSDSDGVSPNSKLIAGTVGGEGTDAAASLSSGKKDIADILMKYERSHWRDIRKEKGIHAMLFPMSSESAMYSTDDIFEDVNDHEDEENDTEDGELDVENI
jgi:initiation factor 1A